MVALAALIGSVLAEIVVLSVDSDDGKVLGLVMAINRRFGSSGRDMVRAFFRLVPEK